MAAARSAHELDDDAAAARELLALLDSCQPGRLVPMQRAERDLARTRLAAGDGRPSHHHILRRHGQRPARVEHPYQLAHGLLDYARHLDPDLEAEYCQALNGPGTARTLNLGGLLPRKRHSLLLRRGRHRPGHRRRGRGLLPQGQDDAARAIATQLDRATAEKITSVHGLLEKLRELGAAR
jgi:hypothetical protein